MFPRSKTFGLKCSTSE